MQQWWKSKKSGWTNFYLFLEESASTAKEEITAESIIAALSSEVDKPHKSSLSHKSAAVTSQESDKLCPVCDNSAHKYATKSGGQGISKRIYEACHLLKTEQRL